MSNFLKIGKDGNFYLDNNLVSTKEVENVNDYLMQLLGFYTTIEEEIRVDELVHSMFGMKKFIRAYFSEEYEAIRAFTSASKLDKKYKYVKFYKSFKVESDDFLSDEEFLYMLPEISFIEAAEGEVGYDNLGELPVVIDDNIILEYNDLNLKFKNKFTLLDILTCLFDEMSYYLKNENIIIV